MSKKNEKQEYQIELNGTTYTIAFGGIHSNESPRKIIPKENEILRDADISSQYPNAIFKRKLYPSHLGEEWLISYGELIKKRISAKKNNQKSISEALKLALNGAYGKTREITSWMYDPEVTYKCTIGNQFEILMLIDSLEKNGIHCVSANTDGILCLFDKSLDEKYYEICDEWENKVGNNKLGKLEYTDYKAIYQTSVNDYFSIKTNGEVKKKGDFTTDFELYKNKSARIIPLTIEQYILNNVDIEEYVKNHNNIFDFCIGKKAKGDSKILSFNSKTGEEQLLQKVNRYYISDDGENLIKRLPPLPNKKVTKQIDIFGNVDTGIRESELEAGWKSKVFNKYIKKEMKDYKINYNYYINKIREIINKFEN